MGKVRPPPGGGNPFLECDPLYGLSETIIEAIKTEVPNFFTPAQEAFERDLARTASFGFFHHRALSVTARDRQTGPVTGLSAQEQHARSAQAIDDMLKVELRRDGLTEGQTREYLQQGAERREVIDTRKAAYGGWLVSNRRFHEEADDLRVRWGSLVQELGRFPTFPRWPTFDLRLGGDVPREFWDAFVRFYSRWGLDQMATWDWPVPMEPDLADGMLQDLHLLSDAGVVLFVPWYLLRGEKLDLQGVVQQARTACEAKHLWDWLHKQPVSRNDEMGDIRFERLGWLYRHHELVLVRRYGAACRGHVQRLDRALAGVIDRDEDTVKKLRLELKRILHGN